MFDRLAAGEVPAELMLDSTHVKAHRSASGAKGGSGAKRSASRAAAVRPKSIAWPILAADPVVVGLTPGNIADINMAVPLLERTAPPRRLIADKAYDTDRLRRWLAERRIAAVIPSTATRQTPYPLNRRACRRRNLIERLLPA